MSKVKYQWPDAFYIVRSGTVYQANKTTHDTYNLHRAGEHVPMYHNVSVEEIEGMFNVGNIKILTDECPFLIEDKSKVHKPQRNISINVNSVYNAAKWDVENNPFTKKRGDTIEIVEDKINDLVENLYNDVMNGEFEYRSIGCGSYTIQFLPEDDKYGVISVLVDPSVGQNSFYVDVKDYLEQT